MPNKLQTNTYGFTLLELAIALTIIGMVTAGYLSYKQFNPNNNALSETGQKLQVIEDALITFLAENGRLPCPASPSQAVNNSTFGQEQISTATQPASCIILNTDIASGSFSSDTAYYGTIPSRSLGLSDDYMLDGWGNRMGYVVQKTFINNRAYNSSCIGGDSARDLHSSDAYFCFEGQASGSVNAATIDLEIRDSYNGNVISGDPVYVLISHGENGYGAYMATSDRDVAGGGSDGPNTNRNPMPPNANDDEQSNLECNPSTNTCNSSSLSNQYIMRPPSGTFDDIITYKNRNRLLIDCNNYLNNECTMTHNLQLK